MALLESRNIDDKTFSRKYIFLDNDFLSVLFSDFEALKSLTSIVQGGYLMVDPFTRFEFLQTIFLPKQRNSKEKFLSDDNVFFPPADQELILKKLNANALVLSNIYAHNNCLGASVIDLVLASRALLHPNALIITGNKKHFPSIIFNVVGVLNHESKNGEVRAFTVIAFDKSKFTAALDRWEKIPF